MSSKEWKTYQLENALDALSDYSADVVEIH